MQRQNVYKHQDSNLLARVTDRRKPIESKSAQPNHKRTLAIGGGTETLEGGQRLIGNIYWEVYSETIVSDGTFATGNLAPSTALLHEAGHGQKYDQAQQGIDGYDLIQFNFDVTEEVGWKWTSPEEKRNITEVDNVYIKQINQWEKENKANPQEQPLRTSHELGSNIYYPDKKMSRDVNKADQAIINQRRKNE